jgi:hypothetical protein
MTLPAYQQPASTVPFPGGLTFTQFVQTVFVGVSGLDGTLVRPAWQQQPPKQPDIDIDWMSIGIAQETPDTYGFIGVDEDDNTQYQRQETVEVQCNIYGPNAIDTYGLIRDGFQIPANLAALGAALMGYTEMSPGLRVPDLINERWFDRIQMSVFFRREIMRVYPILTLVSASGTIHSVVGDEEYLLDFAVDGP